MADETIMDFKSRAKSQASLEMPVIPLRVHHFSLNRFIKMPENDAPTGIEKA